MYAKLQKKGAVIYITTPFYIGYFIDY